MRVVEGQQIVLSLMQRGHVLPGFMVAITRGGKVHRTSGEERKYRDRGDTVFPPKDRADRQRGREYFD